MQENIAAEAKGLTKDLQKKSISPFQTPLIVMNLVRRPLETLDRLFTEYGELVYFPNPAKPTYFLYSPESIQRILGKDAASFYKSVNYDDFDPLLGKGLVTSDGELWKTQRASIEGNFSMLQLKAYLPSIQKHAKEWVLATKQSIQTQGTLTRSVGEDMMTLTYLILGEALFGQDLGNSSKIVQENFPIVTDYLMKRVYITVPRWLPLPGHGQFKKALAAMNTVVFDLIAKERKHNTTHRHHMLARMVQATESGHTMSDKQLRDEVMTMMLAGHETTANTLAWTLYCLASAPQVVERMREELSALARGTDIDFAIYKTLNYTRAVVQEALRLYPPAYLISRQPLVTYDVGGQSLEPKTIVMIPIWTVHRRSDIWPDANEFKPERFSDQKLTSQQRSAFVPFGAGPRRCIGSELAMIEAVIILGYIIREFDILPPKQKAKPHASLTLRASDVRLELRCRKGG